MEQPDLQGVVNTIDNHLATMNASNSHIEIGFFGGNFTGIDQQLQENFLKIAYKYLQNNQIQGIRLSTRPDYITAESLSFLKQYGVSTIELGAQSLDDTVLLKSGRGHTRADVERASLMIREAGIELGLQMMLGLPGDTKEKAVFTAEEIIRLGANNTRIYPCLVIKDTILHQMLQKGEYQSISMEDAVEWSKEVLLRFEASNVTVLRVGLHPSEGFSNGTDLIAGPYHVSFKEFVLSSIWKDVLKKAVKDVPRNESLRIGVNPRQINYAVGYHASNKKYLAERYHSIKFYGDNAIKERNCIIDYGKLD